MGSPKLDFSDVAPSEWPLIGYLYQDAVYKAQYDSYVQEVIDGAFNTSTMQSLYSTYSELIQPYVTTELDGYTFLNSSSDFQTAVNELNLHVQERATVVSDYLNQ